MKRITILFILFISFGFEFHSQIWVQPNAVWHYDYSLMGTEGFVKIEHIGDSVIQNKTTMMLETTDYQFGMNQFGEIIFYGTYVWDTNYVFTEGDTVFYFQNNQYHKLFDFSKVAGESYLIGETDGNDMCSTSSYTEVTGTGVDGLGYNFISLSSPDTSDLRLYGNYNTRFGGGDYLLPRRFWCDPEIIPEYYMFNFKCFQDDGLFYNPSGEDCEYLLTHLGVGESENIVPEIFPNPVADFFKLRMNAPVRKVLLKDLNGNDLKTWTDSEIEDMNVSDFTNGIYILYIELENGSVLSQKLIVQ